LQLQLADVIGGFPVEKLQPPVLRLQLERLHRALVLRAHRLVRRAEQLLMQLHVLPLQPHVLARQRLRLPLGGAQFPFALLDLRLELLNRLRVPERVRNQLRHKGRGIEAQW
jgi:hypothetical protein